MANETQTTEASNTNSGSASTEAKATATDSTVKTDAFTGGEASETKTQQTTAETSTEKKDATETKPGDKPADDKATTEKKTEGEKKEEVKAAPESYADFKLPAGVKIDEEVIGEFKVVAKDLKLPQDAAQKVVDMGAKLADKWGKQQLEAIKTTQEKWVTELKTDKELGGDKLKENLAIAQKGLNAYDKSGKLNALLHETGLARHVDLVRVFHQIGLSMKEDTVVSPNAGGNVGSITGPGSLEQAASVIYGKR